jgi:hypothetical protein
MTNRDFDALIEMVKDDLVELVHEGEYTNKNLSHDQRLQIIEKVEEMSPQEVLALFIGEQDAGRIREFQSKFGRFLRYSLAVIAAGAAGPAAPALGPLIYYLYRRAMEPCKRRCGARHARGPAGKKCKYECQMRHILDMVRKLRSELSKCAQQKKQKKCENKIKREIEKWSNRFEQAKENFEKAEEKMRERRRKTLGYEESARLFEQEDNDKADPGEALIKPSEPNPRVSRIVRLATTDGLQAVPIPLISVALNEIVKRYDYDCMRRCFRKPSVTKRYCHSQCREQSRLNSIRMIRAGLSRCNQAQQPDKCRRKLATMLKDWQRRAVQTARTHEKNENRRRAKLTKD